MFRDVYSYVREANQLREKNKELTSLLTEARDRITLECYGRKPEPETVKTMKKINKLLGD